MADNHIASILISEHQQLLGIATDRDIALEVVAGDLDHATPVHDVMSDEVATVAVTATVEEVVQTTREHACRRVPIVEDGKPVGLVTFDDLILDSAIDLAAARSIIVAQIEAAARFNEEGTFQPDEPARPEMASRRDRAFLRRKARAEAAYARLLRAVEIHSGLTAREHAELSLMIVLSTLCRRVTPDQARHLIAQLPSKLHPELE
jgi:CBS domain-containing protein